MSKMIIMQGLPASGKSTRAEEIIAKEGNTVRINKDLLRTMLHFDKFTGVNEGRTRDAARAIAREFLTNSVNVIVDDTNLNGGTLQSWVDLAKELGAKIQHERIDTSMQECIDRDARREKRVGSHVIKKMAMQYNGYLKGEKVVICDIDGTIADCSHRLQYAKGDGKDWDKFFSLMMSDTPRMDVVERVVQVARENKAMVIFVSARPEKYRTFTMDWLFTRLLGSGIETRFELLIMRENNDKRDDVLVKQDIYDKFLKELNIVKVFDDRPRVIRMWREKGLDVEDVGQGVEF